MKKFGYSKEVNTSFENTIENVINALRKEGFGVLSKIDMQGKIKEKLNKDIDEYIILGACNPLLAYDALVAEYEIGLLLPCNIIIYRKNGKITVSAIIPTIAMNIIDNDVIKEVAKKAEVKFKQVIDSL